MSLLGLRVGPFELVQQAGVPGPDPWYVARRSGMTRKQPRSVLVRVLAPDATPEQRAQLQAAFEALKAHDDPRIPKALAFYEGTGALAVEHADGTPLAAAVAGRASDAVLMTPATLLDILLEVAETLQRAHRKPRIHGHLGPDTVWLAPDGRVWVWGWHAGPGRSPPERWLAPERARGEPAGPHTDQWSLGALAAALVTGMPPWGAQEPLAEARSATGAPGVDAVQAQWPALGRLLRRMLDPRPANRFASLQPVRQELLALARRAGGTSTRRELGARLARDRPTVQRSPERQADELDDAEQTTRPTFSLPTRPPASDPPTQDLARTERFAPPTTPDAPTAEHTAEPLLLPEDPPSEEEGIDTTLQMAGAPSQRDLDEEATVLYSAADVEAALVSDALVVQGGAPTAVPATDSGEPDLQTGRSEPAMRFSLPGAMPPPGRHEPTLPADGGDGPLPPAAAGPAGEPTRNPRTLALGLVGVLFAAVVAWLAWIAWAAT